MINWPPIKAWTSKFNIKGQYHFVVINYAVIDNSYLVNMVSVLDGEVCFGLNLSELNDKTLWIPGWIDIPKGDDHLINASICNQSSFSIGCLHPSNDSGLSIGSSSKEYRPWFPE